MNGHPFFWIRQMYCFLIYHYPIGLEGNESGVTFQDDFSVIIVITL